MAFKKSKLGNGGELGVVDHQSRFARLKKMDRKKLFLFASGLLIVILAILGLIYKLNKKTPSAPTAPVASEQTGADFLADSQKIQENSAKKTTTPQQALDQAKTQIAKAEKDNNKDALGGYYVNAAFAAEALNNKAVAKDYAVKALAVFDAGSQETRDYNQGVIIHLKRITNAN